MAIYESRGFKMAVGLKENIVPYRRQHVALVWLSTQALVIVRQQRDAIKNQSAESN